MMLASVRFGIGIENGGSICSAPSLICDPMPPRYRQSVETMPLVARPCGRPGSCESN